ncbi:major facilitator superfamily domain-containing protein, partial [Aureobasidium melanogenum]
MGFYETNLAVLAAVSTYLLYRQHQSDKQNSAAEAESGMKSALGQDAIKRFKRSFFPAYALVCAADWLQGPHIYALYKYHKHLPETTVAALYASGFVAGALSASFVGQLADKYGRRNACLLYCIIYSIGCFTMLSDDLLILFAGRACGGISTTLLYSVFETWMIAEYHDQALDAYGLSLGSMFGKMTTLSSVVAIASGVVGDLLVKSLDSKTSPFMASVVCLVLALIFISKRWNENYGDNASSRDKDGEFINLSSILFDPQIISVGLASCFFEGGMYMFVFFWSAALSTVHAAVGFTDPLPFGVVFSSYMCSMMVGSIVFTLVPPSHDKAHYILKIVLTSASICFLSSILLKSEALVFWAFCLFEVCVGAYFPSMASLKGKLIQDGSRGRIYGILRLPLNLFVITAHSLAEEGDRHRNNVFLTCGGLLIITFIVVQRYLTNPATTSPQRNDVHTLVMPQPNQKVELECAGCGKVRGIYEFSASQRRKGDDATCLKCIPEIQNVKPGHLKHDIDNSDAEYLAHATEHGSSTRGSSGTETGGVRLPSTFINKTATVAGTNTGTGTRTTSTPSTTAPSSSRFSSATSTNERPAHFELRSTGWMHVRKDFREEIVPKLADDDVETFKDGSDDEDFDM